MGRKKSYDRDMVIENAIKLFRQHGYKGASAELLSSELGLNRYSLYAEFGSKEGLFGAALARYSDEVITPKWQSLEADNAGLDEIIALIRFYGEKGPEYAWGQGCLLCNTAVEFSAQNEFVTPFTQDYFAQISRALKAALSSAQARGELREDVEINAEAGAFAASILGIFVMLRGEADQDLIKDTTQGLIARVEVLRGDKVPENARENTH